ncbi:hypothetical protein PoB_004838500 [Plakobranchus ocellatus]|uniref:DDE Tnp4 domain-containing protein n=1 Tax=Plakobranchus ocellatus TaxID=259542 RepID=A0AAV4BMV9_9GAST|nr:hypothetical protein PoB_004838500 [Plakobranchus ocellatus]
MTIAKPKQHQKVVFSGHKRIHCLKFQGIMTPNGLFAHMFRPMEGRRHDAAMFHESGIMTTLEETMNRPDGTPLCLYGDPAYRLRPHVMKPFMGARLTREQEFNKDMSSVRISVEWSFGKISNLFAFVDLKKNLKLYLQTVGKIFLVASILANCHITPAFTRAKLQNISIYLHHRLRPGYLTPRFDRTRHICARQL